MIASITPIPPVPMRCITVDSPSRLYLAGPGMIPTHNTHVLTNVMRAWAMSGVMPVVGAIGATSDDTRRVLIEGDSGVMATSPRWERPLHKKQDRLLQWPNGAVTYLFSAEEPDRLRGANLYGLLADELAAWKDPDATWDQAMLTLRVGPRPRAVIATTPRPIPIIRRLASDPATFLTTGSTYDNAANLAKTFLDTIVRRYEGTRLGAQELQGLILMETPEALFPAESIRYWPEAPLDKLKRIIVSVDPTGSSKGDECGIAVVGDLGPATPEEEVRWVVLDDRSMSGTPLQWATAAAKAFDFWQADRVIAETNFGGDLVVSALQQHAPNLPVTKIHAARGKLVRAEPVALVYEQGRVAHLRPFPKLESQLGLFSASQGYMGAGSPDRADAVVHGVTYLMAGKGGAPSGAAQGLPKAPDGSPLPSTIT
jgi:phage terminase large subunit-like protein